MVYRKVTIRTTAEAEEILASALFDLGLLGVEIEDRIPLSEADTKAMFIDILPELGPDDGLADLSFYVEMAADQEAKRQRLLEAGQFREMQADPAVDASYAPAGFENVYTEEEFSQLLDAIRREIAEMRQYVDAGEGRIAWTETEDKDWANNWKQYFHPFSVGDILLKPSWEEVPAGWEGRLCIELDPGTSFGTGQHESTQLCLMALEKYLRPGMEVADIGTGSGILGIAALLLGASHVTGTDLDGDCFHAVQENLRLNGIPADTFQFLKANAVGRENARTREEMGYGRYDLVLANILAPVIALLIQDVASLLRPGGIFIASGILAEKEGEIRSAAEAQRGGLEILEFARQGDWSCFVFRHEGNPAFGEGTGAAAEAETL